jgi:hypothetical protein
MKINAGLGSSPEGRALNATQSGGEVCRGLRSDRREEAMSMRDAYERKMQAQLNEWAAEIKKLKAKADQAEADAQIEYYRQIERLKQEQERAEAKLEELRHASEGAWEDLKGGVEKAWLDLGEAVRAAASRFG